jgi:ATP-dependent RNA helicase DDX10/DBP4
VLTVLQAFVSYLRSVHLHKDKSIFKVAELPVKAFAASLGLPGAPKIKFLSKEIAKQRKNASRALSSLTEPKQAALRKKNIDEEDEDDEDEEDDASAEEVIHSSSEEEETTAGPTKPSQVGDCSLTYRNNVLTDRVIQTTGVRTKYDRMFERKNQNVLSEHYTKLVDHSREDDDDDFITLKRADHELPSDSELPTSDHLSKRKLKMGESRRAMLKYKPQPTKLRFDEEGRPYELYEMEAEEAFYGAGEEGVREKERQFAMEEREKLAEADVVDREVAKERKKEKKRKRKERERAVCLAHMVCGRNAEGYPDR